MTRTHNVYTIPDKLESWKKAGKLENCEKLHFPDPALPQKAGNCVASWNHTWPQQASWKIMCSQAGKRRLEPRMAMTS